MLVLLGRRVAPRSALDEAWSTPGLGELEARRPSGRMLKTAGNSSVKSPWRCPVSALFAMFPLYPMFVLFPLFAKNLPPLFPKYLAAVVSVVLVVLEELFGSSKHVS